MKVLHFATDSVFLDGVIAVWDKCVECDCRYIVRKNRHNRGGLKKIKSKRAELLTIREIKKILFINIQSYDIIILHNLYSLPYYITLMIPQPKAVVWFLWGADIYENSYPAKPLVKINDLLGKETLKLYRKKQGELRNRLQKILFKLYARFLKHDTYTKFKLAVSRINYCAGVIPLEYDELCKCDFFKAKQVFNEYIPYPCPFEEDKVSELRERTESMDIVVGNSGSFTNNHLEAFNILKKLHIKDRKIIVPLSYGDPYYTKSILKKGHQYFGKSFLPLIKFMLLSDYQKVLSSCSFAVYAVERQQATCNICLALWDGKKVFLSENTLVYIYLKKLGIKLFSIQSELNEKEINTRLDYKDIVNNRKIVAQNFSFASALKKVKGLLFTVSEDIKVNG